MSNAIEICRVSDFYEKMLEAFSGKDDLVDFDINGNEISKAIYYQMCSMKFAGYKHRVNFNRAKKHTMAELFQDIIAFYLSKCLDSNAYEIFLEQKESFTVDSKKKYIYPDILIKKNGENFFVIEVKTTIGWSRTNLPENIQNRIDLISSSFNIPKENILYIFEEVTNNGKDFEQQFWDSDTRSSRERSAKFPYSIIYPLFVETDPYYWKLQYEKYIDEEDLLTNLSKDYIMNKSEACIVTRFESIIDVINNAKLVY